MRCFIVSSAVYAAVVAFCLWGPAPLRVPVASSAPSAAAGEQLLHRAGPFGPRGRDVSARLPFGSLTVALYENHLPLPLYRIVDRLLACAPLASMEAAWLAGGGPFGGLLAAALSRGLPFSDMGEALVFELLILLCAAAIAWRAQEPTPFRGVVVGLALAAALQCRSTLVLFPALLAAYDWSLGRRGRLIAPLALAYAPILPWVAMNWALWRRIVPFELGRLDNNAVTAALGWVGAMDGDVSKLASVPADGVLRWALRETALHPLRYLAGFAGRLWWFATLKPALLIAAVAAVWCERRREPVRQVALLAACFVLTHCLFSIVPRYFDPVWHVLAVLAAVGLGARLPKAVRRPAPAFVAVAGAAAAVLLAWSTALVARFPSGLADERGVMDDAVASAPDEAYVRYSRGVWLASRGQPGSAFFDLQQAAAKRPTPSAHIALAWVSAALGARDAASDFAVAAADADPLLAPEADALEVLWELDAGRERRAAKVLARARAAYSANGPLVFTASGGTAPAPSASAADVDRRLRLDAGRLLAAWPADRRAAIEAGLTRITR